MELAIVIPYYKNKFFESTLQSLVDQTDQRFNVYIGDDASPVSPTNIIDSFATLLSIKYCRFQNNLGCYSLPGQWMRCIELVKNEKWIMILGDDDTLDPNCVSEFHRNLEHINSNGISVVRFASTVIDEKGNPLTKTFQHPKQEKATNFFVRKAKGGTRSSLSEYIFREEKLMEVGLRNFSLGWHTDDALLIEVSDFGNIFTINEASVNFRHSSENITQKRNNLSKKADASWNYYKFLLENIDKFSKDERALIYEHYERAFLNNKKSLRAWYFTLIHYIGNYRLRELKNLINRVYKTLKKKF